jgi:hypothetical protein
VIKKTPWPQSASELYRPSDRSLSTKLVPTFVDRRCRVVSGRISTAVFSVWYILILSSHLRLGHTSPQSYACFGLSYQSQVPGILLNGSCFKICWGACTVPSDVHVEINRNYDGALPLKLKYYASSTFLRFFPVDKECTCYSVLLMMFAAEVRPYHVILLLNFQ